MPSPAPSSDIGRTGAEALRPEDRLRLRGDFEETFRSGVRVRGARFLLVAKPAQATRSRLGVAVGRRLGGAVVRNRLKRQLREAFRRCPELRGASLDLVVCPGPEAVGASQAELVRDLLRQARVARRRLRP